ncbi:IS3 family transposase, partial [Burkholderia ubonensis]|uniref:IS3 family transposase n=3 Tax=Burkholderia ubonensis TaxID=101571 RepID=UPI0012F98DF3
RAVRTALMRVLRLQRQVWRCKAPFFIRHIRRVRLPCFHLSTYLAGLKDLYSGEIVGYAMSERMTKHLVMQALFRAVATRRPPAGLIHHSDRGSQYCALAYQSLVNQFDMRASMSRRGNCYDNAPIESFWGTLKNELVYHQRFATREQARHSISEYIEIFYNRQRTQARLNYQSPVAFTQRFYLNQIAA